MDTDASSSSSSSSNSLIVDNSDSIDMRVASSSSSTYGTKSAKQQSRAVRVLLVDYDTIALYVILAMLKKFGYEAVGTTGGLHGLKLLREKPYYFDLVVAAVQMPGMSGLELLQRIKLEFTNLPVVLVSNDTDPVMTAKGFSNGAGHLLRKPVTFYDVENMWLHVQKSKMDETVNKNRYKGQTGSAGQDSLRRKEKHRSVSGSPSGDDERSSRAESRKRKGSCKDQSSDDKKNRTNKKRRVVWTAQLHTHFLNAIECLGVDSAVPKKILEYMKVPGLTRENVASHLQKYRLFVKGIVERNQNIEPNIVKSLANRAYLSNFATDMSPMNMQQTDAPQQSFTPSRIRTGDFQGLNTDQTCMSHRGAPTFNTSSSGGYSNASFQFGQPSMLPVANNQELIAASSRHPWPTSNSNQNAATVAHSQSNSNVSIGGGRSGKGTMEMVHRQNMVRWRSNVQSTAGPPLNPGTQSMINRFNFQRQNNTEMVRNIGTTRNVGSSSVGSFAQALTPNTNNFTGFRIINDNTNSPEALHIGQVAHKLPNDSNNSASNLNFSFVNKPPSVSSVMEVSNQMTEFPNMSSSVSAMEVVPNLVLEVPGVPSSVCDIEEVWDLSDNYYLTDQSSTLEQDGVTRANPKFSEIITTAQNEISLADGFLNANPQQETADPTPAVPIPAQTALNATEVEQAVEEEGDPFEGLFDLARSDSIFEVNSLPPLLDEEDITGFLENFKQSTADFDIGMYQLDVDDSIFQL